VRPKYFQGVKKGTVENRVKAIFLVPAVFPFEYLVCIPRPQKRRRKAIQSAVL